MPKNMFDEFVYHLPEECTLMNEITRIAEAAEITKQISFHTATHLPRYQ